MGPACTWAGARHLGGPRRVGAGGRAWDGRDL